MLYQDVRPKKLEDFIGHKSLKSSLQGLLKQDKKDTPHTFLFSGDSGCGKTTLARILSSEFGCIDQNIFEYNAANTRGIDSIRDLTDKVAILPMGGTAKAYILDESHQLTKAAQQSLLKVIEDVPEHVYFFFCTTNPENLIKTIRNRCAEYTVGKLRKNDIRLLIVNALAEKDYQLDSDLIEVLMEMSDGTPRSTLVSLEKVLTIEDVDEAIELLITGSENDSSVMDLAGLILIESKKRKGKFSIAIELLDELQEAPERIRMSLLGILWSRIITTDQSETDYILQIGKSMDILNSSYYGQTDKYVLRSMIIKIFIG